MSPLSDEDIDRIASRTAGKLVDGAIKLAFVLLLGFWLIPTILIFSLTGMASATVGLPGVVQIGLTASVIAIPLVALVLGWGRMRRR